MNTYIIIGIGLGILLFLIFKRSIFGTMKKSEQRKFPGPDVFINDDKLNVVVSELIKRGKKIEAIKFVRETKKISLLDAKNFVEKIEMNIKNGNQNFVQAKENVYSETAVDTELVNKVKALIISGKKLSAIKLIVDEQKKGLAEAKDYVEKIESEIKKL